VRAGKWKLVKRYKKSLELYDLESDIGETDNLAEQYPQQLERLAGMLEGARTHHPEFTLKKLPNSNKKAQAEKKKEEQ
jgi:hypothetical protein